MELNRNQIIKALECCKSPLTSDCATCAYKGKSIKNGIYVGCVNTLIADALALIKELTEENGRLSGKVAEYEEERKYHFEMSRKRISETKADTVRKMQERITKHATNGYPRKVRLDVIDQIAKEMVEGDK